MVEPLHLKSVCRRQFKQFINALWSSPTLSDQLGVKGCGLSYIAKDTEKHYEIESKQLKRIETRLIGSQAISLPQYRYDKSHFTGRCIP